MTWCILRCSMTNGACHCDEMRSPLSWQKSDGVAARHFQSRNTSAIPLDRARRAVYTHRCARHIWRCGCGPRWTRRELKKASTQANGRWSLGIKRKVRVTRSFLSIVLIDRARMCVRSRLAGLKTIHTYVDNSTMRSLSVPQLPTSAYR